MRRSAALAPLVAVAALAAGCGGSSGSTGAPAAAGSSPAPSTAAHMPAPQSQLLVLTQADAGRTYWTVQDQTSPMTLAETAKGDPAGIKAIERQAFVSGYKATYGAPGLAVVSTASVFRSTSAARTVVADWGHRGLSGLPHAVVQRIPGGGPGQDAVMVRGAVAGASGQTIPAWVITWRHGAVVGGTVVVGPHASAGRLLALAHRQDRRIALALAG